jgi:hypothetical protein
VHDRLVVQGRLRCERARDLVGRIGNGDAGSGSGFVGF